MKIHFIIEFETDPGGVPQRMKVERLTPMMPLKAAAEAPQAPHPVAESHSAAPTTPDEAASPKRNYDSTRRYGRETAALRRMPTPFTRAALAAELDCSKESATAHLNRLQKRGWVESPAHGLWRTTKKFLADNS